MTKRRAISWCNDYRRLRRLGLRPHPSPPPGFAGERAVFDLKRLVTVLSLTVSLGTGSIGAHEHTLPAYVTSLGSAPNRADTEPTPADGCQLTLTLTDESTGGRLDGLVRVTDTDGAVLPLPELFNRGTGLPRKHAARQWRVVLESATVTVPKQRLMIEALSGLETELTRKLVDLADKESYDLTLPLVRFHRPADEGWHNGNTHLHLRSLTREQADEYLRSISRADELELAFVSYLTRAKADHAYISNTYTKEDLERLSGRDVLFDWAIEHRHNFGPGGEGFGHVMFLNTKKLIEPVSIGPGIMGQGTDWPSIRHGIDQAREQGATIVWCHNTFGHEDVPDWIAGVIDANNIFDGGSRGDYADSFYRFMNVGLRVPFSTGTDWFIYDFSRVYVDVKDSLTISSWLNALKEGKTFITNGPMLNLEVDGYGPGGVIRLDKPAQVKAIGRVVGRRDFQAIELIHNGRVVATAQSTPAGGHFEGQMDFTLSIDEPGWVALRIESDEKTELGGELFGHTSAVYFELAGKTIFRSDVAETLIAEMRTAMGKIQEQATFGDDSEREDVLDIYREGIGTLMERLSR